MGIKHTLILGAIWGCCSVLLLSCAKKRTDGYAEIKGIATTTNAEPVRLYKVIHGAPEELATVVPQPDGNFGFLFKPEYKGFYVLGRSSANDMAEKYLFYFEGNDQLNLTISDSAYTLTGENSSENQILLQWSGYRQPIANKVLSPTYKPKGDPKERYAEIEQLDTDAQRLLRELNSGNTHFDSLMGIVLHYDPLMLASQVARMERNIESIKTAPYFQGKKMSSYLHSDSLLRYPYGQLAIVPFLYLDVLLGNAEGDIFSTREATLDAIPDTVLKGIMALSFCKEEQNYQTLMEYKKKYEPYLVTSWLKQQMDAVISALPELAPGRPAIAFSLPDIDGNTVSMSDFRGKLVLVDVWATWCGPCRQIMPLLKKLERKYHGKDIVFVGISIDEKRDKWEEFVKKEKLADIQLYDGDNGVMSGKYGIQMIPTIMLFDKQGNIITTHAPSPREESLQTLIDEWLQK